MNQPMTPEQMAAFAQWQQSQVQQQAPPGAPAQWPIAPVPFSSQAQQPWGPPGQPIAPPIPQQWTPPGAPSSRIAELRAQMLGAQVYGKGQYFPTGKHRVVSKLVKYNRSVFEGTAKESIIAEFTVAASSVQSVVIGETRSVVFAYQNAGWLSRFKALVLALAGLDPDAPISPQANERAADIYVALMLEDERARMGLSPDFLCNITLDVEAFPGTSRKGVQVTNLKWSPVRA